MHLGRIILLATSALSLAVPCLAQTGKSSSGGTAGLKPDKVPIIHASKSPEEALSAYKQAKQEALKKMVKLAGVPPATPVRAGSDCQALIIVVRDSLNGIEKKYLIKTTLHSAGSVMTPAQMKGLREYIEQERKQWDDVSKMTQAAANYQIEMRINKAMLEKAAEDAPQQIKALVEELREVEKSIKEYLKSAGRRGDESKRRKSRQFVTTVTGNVEHAWASLVKSGQEIFSKKEYKPSTYKKQMDRIISTLPHQIGHISKADEQFAQAAGDIAKQMKKSHKKYEELYDKAAKACQPLITGSAAKEVPTFRDAKPDGLLARVKERIQ